MRLRESPVKAGVSAAICLKTSSIEEMPFGPETA